LLLASNHNLPISSSRIWATASAYIIFYAIVHIEVSAEAQRAGIYQEEYVEQERQRLNFVFYQ
jgi:hypothetical protein